MRISCCFLLLLGALGCAGVPGPDAGTSAPPPPNVIVMLVDDLGKEWISAYGAEDINTPHIDRLAASGIRFDNTYGMPQCTPSRVTLLTGQYPFRHGWVNHWDVPRWGGGAHFDETHNPALVQGMKAAGYRTCIAGKWQIDDFRVEPDALTKIGFDEYCMWTGYESGNPQPSENRYHAPYLYTSGGSRTYDDAYGPDVFKDFVVDFIRANRDTSMFIYYPMVLTHTPFENPPGDSATTDLGKHLAMVKYTDYLTGEIVRTLEEEGIRENTLILWTTDNGTTRSIVGTRNGREVQGGKTQTTEAGVCLPFIASWPAVIAGEQVSDALIDFTDVLPTCLDVAGTEIGKHYPTGEQNHTIDGVSFAGVLTGKEASARDWILSMGGGNRAKRTNQGVENQYVFRDRVIRDQRFKLRVGTDRKAVEFYDLLKDPAEEVNLIDSLHTPLRKAHFAKLNEAVQGFPKRDADPHYAANPPQPWDVPVSARSQTWKQ